MSCDLLFPCLKQSGDVGMCLYVHYIRDCKACGCVSVLLLQNLAQQREKFPFLLQVYELYICFDASTLFHGVVAQVARQNF